MKLFCSGEHEEKIEECSVLVSASMTNVHRCSNKNKNKSEKNGKQLRLLSSQLCTILSAVDEQSFRAILCGDSHSSMSSDSYTVKIVEISILFCIFDCTFNYFTQYENILQKKNKHDYENLFHLSKQLINQFFRNIDLPIVWTDNF